MNIIIIYCNQLGFFARVLQISSWQVRNSFLFLLASLLWVLRLWVTGPGLLVLLLPASFLTSFLPARGDGAYWPDPSAPPASVFARLFLRLTWSAKGRQSSRLRSKPAGIEVSIEHKQAGGAFCFLATTTAVPIQSRPLQSAKWY